MTKKELIDEIARLDAEAIKSAKALMDVMELKKQAEIQLLVYPD